MVHNDISTSFHRRNEFSSKLKVYACEDSALPNKKTESQQKQTYTISMPISVNIGGGLYYTEYDKKNHELDGKKYNKLSALVYLLLE